MLALLLAGGIVAGAAGRSTPTSATSPLNSVQRQVPLPGPGQASVDLFTVKVTARKGKVGPLTIASRNDATLPPGIRAVAAITRVTHRRSATFKVFILINNLASGTRVLARARIVDSELIFNLREQKKVKLAIRHAVISKDCIVLNSLGTQADASHAVVAKAILQEVAPLRSESVQPSDPEAVLDYVIYNLCSTQGAEVPEPGPE